jgi:hypothetical protein
MELSACCRRSMEAATRIRASAFNSSQGPRHPLCIFCAGDAAVRRRLQRFAVKCAKLRNIESPTETNLLRIIFLKVLPSSS